MYPPQKQGAMARFREYMRYQSRFGHERLALWSGAVAIIATGVLIWRMFAQ